MIIVLDDVDRDELEEYIAVLMDQEFDTILEDGSTVKVIISVEYSTLLISAHVMD